MKKEITIAVIALILIITILALDGGGFSGRVIDEDNSLLVSNSQQFGPSQEEQTCMKKCVTDAGCTLGDVACSEKNNCLTKCNVAKPKQTSEGSCVETCTLKGCEEFDFNCQKQNQEKCDKECGMLGDKPDESEMSAEQLCITRCVESIDKTIRCGASKEGETGGEVCQRCASECVSLYAGPCLDDAKLKAKQKECETCEHCYGEPVMGDSGEGWECITEVECKDASGEFGDEPGIGEGIVKQTGEAIGNVVENIGNFFKGIFGIKSNEENSPEN